MLISCIKYLIIFLEEKIDVSKLDCEDFEKYCSFELTQEALYDEREIIKTRVILIIKLTLIHTKDNYKDE